MRKREKTVPDDLRHELMVKRALQSFVHLHGFTSHQHESYEHFLHFMLPEIIEEQSPILVFNVNKQVLHRLTFERVCFKKPTILEANGFLRTLMPSEAQLRKQSYCVDVLLDLRHEVFRSHKEGSSLKLVQHQLYQEMHFTKIPCMVGSSACHTYQNFDIPQRDRGVFVINGYERVLITQEKLKTNT